MPNIIFYLLYFLKIYIIAKISSVYLTILGDLSHQAPDP